MYVIHGSEMILILMLVLFMFQFFVLFYFGIVCVRMCCVAGNNHIHYIWIVNDSVLGKFFFFFYCILE